MEFSIVEKRDNDRFVLHDMKNKGKACASKYTIKQLIANGHKVYGFDGKNITICSITGTPSKKEMKYSDIPDTKRSLSTFEAGIKPSRAEKKTNKEKAAKKKETIKAKKQEEEKKKKYLEIKRKKRYKTKPLFELLEEDLWGSEYDDGGEYTYRVYIKSPAAQATVNKMIKEGFIDPQSFTDKVSDGDKVIAKHPIDEELHNCQVVAASTVKLNFDNHYTSESVFCYFYAHENFEFLSKNASFRKSDENIRIGSVANGGSTLKSEGIWLRKSLGLLG